MNKVWENFISVCKWKQIWIEVLEALEYIVRGGPQIYLVFYSGTNISGEIQGLNLTTV